jgi:hypothetical protein
LLEALNSHIKLAAVDCCKIFGCEKEDIHWKKTPTGDDADENIQNFERALRIYTAFSKDQWEEYRRTMLAMRDTFVARLDIKKPITEPVPLFDAALQVAYAYQGWVRDVIKPVMMSRGALSREYEIWKAEASEIVSRYPHP